MKNKYLMREELIKNSKFMSMRDEIMDFMVKSGDNVIQLLRFGQPFDEIVVLKTQIDFMLSVHHSI